VLPIWCIGVEITEHRAPNSEHGDKQWQTMACRDCGLSGHATWRRPSHVSAG